MKYLRLLLPLGALMLLQACNLEKEVSIDLPAYYSEPVVECYLEPGKPYRLLLTRAFGYFDGFDLGDPLAALINDATVTIRHQGKEIPLTPSLYFDVVTGKFANYGSPELVPGDQDQPFELLIYLADGHRLEAVTRILPAVPIDSVVAEFRQDTLARVLTYVSDDPGTANYYRRMLHFGSLDSLALQDFVLDDKVVEMNRIVFGTGFQFRQGDTLINTLVHMDRAYYDFLNTLRQSINANFNPFGQPGLIVSNIGGTRSAIGIFTGLSFARDTIIIP